ncbi:AntA/AntB antirepressor [Methylomagnum ishizawai]|uniref:AntA/AntB antirepressor n=1 Tax=Methylomagnum ishizawai TaxID=1760988 RepID=A0A1Y6D0G0_9GAMM|nr:antA/AntB antirepressor family protein [Methylomagnum ishizawai]SMF96117.1 AntA/AntB antirepressor [Methylomagnum ishizawai]
MNDQNLVPVFTGELNGQPVQLVNARDLYGFLEVARDFSTWIKKRLKDGGFIQDQDYLLTQTGEQLPSGTKHRIDYHLTLETAKHIGMMERNDKGHEVRCYFIECERKAHAAAALPPPPEPAARISERIFTDFDYGIEAVAAVNQFIQACLDAARSGQPLPKLGELRDKIADGLCVYALHERRYLVSFGGPVRVTPLPESATVLDPHNPKDMSAAVGQLVPVGMIPEIVNLCVRRLAGKGD